MGGAIDANEQTVGQIWRGAVLLGNCSIPCDPARDIWWEHLVAMFLSLVVVIMVMMVVVVMVVMVVLMIVIVLIVMLLLISDGGGGVDGRDCGDKDDGVSCDSVGDNDDGMMLVIKD